MFNQDQVTPIKPNPKPVVVNDSIDRTRPQGNPRSDKDFKKMVDPDRKNDKEEIASVDERDEESTPSLFDLSAKKKTGKKDVSAFKSSLVSADRPSQAVDKLTNNEDNSSSQNDEFDALFSSLYDDKTSSSSEEIPQPYPLLSDDQAPDVVIEQPKADDLTPLAKTDPSILDQASREVRVAGMQQGRLKSDRVASDADALGISSTEKNKKAKTDNQFAQETTDLSYINPVQQRSSNDIQASIGNIAEPPSTRFDALKEIVDRITESIQTIQYNGRTETVITLKHPPILDGSQINLTSFDSAKGEFNIAFTNLTGPAKQFLDRRLTGDALTAALEQKGFVVHIITTSTLQETPIIQTETERFAQRERGQGQQQEQRNQDEEET